MTVVTTRFSGRTFNTQEMRTVIPRIAPRGPAPCAAEAVFAETRAFLSSREARQMSEGDLERELHRRRQELVRKLLQEHRGQRSPREAAGPVEGASAGGGGHECSERREHERHTENDLPHSADSASGVCAARSRRSASARCRAEPAAAPLPCRGASPDDHRDRLAGTAAHGACSSTALDIIHTGRLVPAATWRAAPVAGSIGRGLSALVRSTGARARCTSAGLPFSISGTAQSSLTA